MSFTQDDLDKGLRRLTPGNYQLIVPPHLEEAAEILAGNINNVPAGDDYRPKPGSFCISVKVEAVMNPDTWCLMPEWPRGNK